MRTKELKLRVNGLCATWDGKQIFLILNMSSVFEKNKKRRNCYHCTVYFWTVLHFIVLSYIWFFLIWLLCVPEIVIVIVISKPLKMFFLTLNTHPVFYGSQIWGAKKDLVITISFDIFIVIIIHDLLWRSSDFFFSFSFFSFPYCFVDLCECLSSRQCRSLFSCWRIPKHKQHWFSNYLRKNHS